MQKKYFKLFFKNFKSKTFELIDYQLFPRDYEEQKQITSNKPFKVFQLDSFCDELHYTHKYISEVKVKHLKDNNTKANTIFIIKLKRLTYKSTWEWLIKEGLDLTKIKPENKKRVEGILNEKRMKHVRKYLESINKGE